MILSQFEALSVLEIRQRYSQCQWKHWNNTCMWCMFGAHMEKEPNKFQLMQDTHPQIYDYCINKLGCGKVMDYCGIKYKKEEECEQQELITLE